MQTKKLTTRAAVVLFVMAAVGLNVFSAIVLKTLADQSPLPIAVLLGGVVVVMLINALRLVVWYFANRRFPLSTLYPLTSIFYPIMLVVSYSYGESIDLLKIIGTLFITMGVFWLGWTARSHEYAVP